MKNSSLFNVRGFRKAKWFFYRTYIGARSIISPYVTHIVERFIIEVGAILAKDKEPYGVYTGNPAQKTTNRRILY